MIRWLTWERHKKELYDELATHLRLDIEDRIVRGEHPDEARAAAVREMGDIPLIEDVTRNVWGWERLEQVAQDLRFALRQLRRSPAFTIAAILTLALAIGANAVVFGVMDALLLRPLQVPRFESLYGTHYGDGSGFQSYPNYIDLRDRNHSFEDLACFNFALVGFDPGNDPSNSTGSRSVETTSMFSSCTRISDGFFMFRDEHGQDSAAYVVLSFAYWHSRFQGDRGVLVRIVQIDGHPFTVIGVAAPEFRGTVFFVSPDFFLPIVNQQQVGGGNAFTERGNTQGVFKCLGIFGRV